MKDKLNLTDVMIQLRYDPTLKFSTNDDDITQPILLQIGKDEETGQELFIFETPWEITVIPFNGYISGITDDAHHKIINTPNYPTRKNDKDGFQLF